MPDKPQDVQQYFHIGCGRCKLGGTPDCKVKSWTKELVLLRDILLKTDLSETIKWSVPCYTFRGRNVLTMSALKESVVVSFFRGAELSDPKDLLERPGENSRFARYLKVTNAEQISALKSVLLDYVEEAIELEKSGKKPKGAVSVELPLPDELLQAFESDRDFQKAFEMLTPGRQRGYLIHFTSAKQSKTRTKRIEKSMSQISAGKGWNEH